MESNIAPPRKPGVSVILPCRNEAENIDSCVRSILQQSEIPGGIEIVIADGMSDDGTRELLDRLGRNDPRIIILENPRRNAAAGLNLAIRAAKADILLRMDAHTEYAPDYVRRCVELIAKTGADNVGGPAGTKAETYRERAVAAAYHSPFSVGGARFHDVNFEGYVDTVAYGCWRRHAFERFGYFDEELVRNQDDEHNLRIIRGRGKIWQSPQIQSWYRPRGSLQALFRQYMQYGYWKVRVIQKHKLPASWRHLVPGGFLLALLCLLLTAVLSSLASSLWPSVDGVGRLSRLSLAVLVVSYSAALLAASCLTAKKGGWSLLPILPLVFGCYHLGYGYGFLHGVRDFILGSRRVNPALCQLTR